MDRTLRKMSSVLGVVVVAGSLAVGAHAATPLPRPATKPLSGPVVTGFTAPEPDWLPGHRGIDLGGWPGDVVVAAAAGTVTFAGPLAGRGVVVVDHGTVRTTYEPVDPHVTVGQTVVNGTRLGTLVAGHAGCPTEACLHLGLKEGERYLDPRSLFGGHQIRLVPAAGAIEPSTAAAGGVPATAAGGIGLRSGAPSRSDADATPRRSPGVPRAASPDSGDLPTTSWFGR